MHPNDDTDYRLETDHGLAKYVERLVGPTQGPDCPDPADLLDAELGTARPEVAAAVGRHLATGCRFCAAKTRAYERWLGRSRGVAEPAPRPEPRSRRPVAAPTAIALSLADAAAPVVLAAGAPTGTPDARPSLNRLAAERNLDRLRPLLRSRFGPILERAGLAPGNDPLLRADRVERLVSLVCDRIGGWTGGERFAACLPGWVAEFAAEHDLTDQLVPLPELTPEVLEDLATAHVLASPAGEPVRDAARAAGARTALAVRQLPPPAAGRLTGAEWAKATAAAADQIVQELAFWTRAV